MTPAVYAAMFDELRKLAAEKPELAVYSYVAKSSLPQVMEHGLHSGKSLIKNPALLESAAQARGITADKMRKDIEANLSTWKGYSSLGPNVTFSTIDPDAKLHEKHPTKMRELVAVKVDLSALLKDQPKTRLYGMELRPYDEYKKDKAAGPRHRYLKHKEVVELTSKTPKEIWSTYNDIDGRGLYAPDVPHAAVHTPSGHIDPKYIKLAADVVYHGSSRKLKTISARNEHGDRGTEDTVFATPSRSFALAYAGGGKAWRDRDIEQSTHGDRMTLREMRPGAFKDTFGKPGYLYTLPGDGFTAAGRKSQSEVLHAGSVTPLHVEKVDALKELQADPKVELHTYDPGSPATLAAVQQRVKQVKGMDPKSATEYAKWWLAAAAPETKAMFKKEMGR